MTKCVMCCNVIKNQNYSVCNDCVRSNTTLDNLVCFGKEWTADVPINGFLSHYFEGHIDELEEILVMAIRQKSERDPDEVKKIFEEFVDFDRESFADWLEEKWNTER